MAQGRQNRKVVSAVSGVETRRCTTCGRVLPITEFYKSGGGRYKSKCKDCCRERASERRRAHRADQPGVRRCKKCGKEKPISEFYFRTHGISSLCMECERTNAREYYHVHAETATQEQKDKRRAYQAKYRAEHREQLNEYQRVRRRKAGGLPQKRVDKKKILKMYAEGVPVQEIAQECNSTPRSVMALANRAGVKRETRVNQAQVCRNCWLYPCFRGIDTMSSNLALTCRRWHLRGKS